jgi:hypothetical protein
MALPLAEHLSPDLETALIHRCHRYARRRPSLALWPAARMLAARLRIPACMQRLQHHASRTAEVAGTGIRARTQQEALAACQLVSSKARTGWMAAFADFSLSGTRETIFS